MDGCFLLPLRDGRGGRVGSDRNVARRLADQGTPASPVGRGRLLPRDRSIVGNCYVRTAGAQWAGGSKAFAATLHGATALSRGIAGGGDPIHDARDGAVKGQNSPAHRAHKEGAPVFVREAL